MTLLDFRSSHAPSIPISTEGSRTISRRSQGARLLMQRAVPVQGFCTADLQGKLAKYRIVPSWQVCKLYHMGLRLALRCRVSRSTLADANEKRDWRMYADFGVQLDQTVYALGSSTIDLCLSLFPRAKLRKTKAAIKLHTLR